MVSAEVSTTRTMARMSYRLGARAQDKHLFHVFENVDLMNCRSENLGRGINRFPELRTKESTTFRLDGHVKDIRRDHESQSEG